MENIKLLELSQLIERKINYRNAYKAKPNFNSHYLKYFDEEIRLLEELLSDFSNMKNKMIMKLRSEREKIFNAGREDGYIEATTGRRHPLNFYIS